MGYKLYLKGRQRNNAYYEIETNEYTSGKTRTEGAEGKCNIFDTCDKNAATTSYLICVKELRRLAKEIFHPQYIICIYQPHEYGANVLEFTPISVHLSSYVSTIVMP